MKIVRGDITSFHFTCISEAGTMKKLAVFFPGAGYGMDCPLLYYADFLFETKGYERLKLNYQDILLNKEMCLDDKLAQLRAYITKEFDAIHFNAYEEIVFISKSIGCVEAGRIAEKYVNLSFTEFSNQCKMSNPIQIFLTPVADALPYCSGNSRVIIGTKDKAYPLFKEHCAKHRIPALFIEGGDHSLEIADKPFESIEVLKKVLTFIQE